MSKVVRLPAPMTSAEWRQRANSVHRMAVAWKLAGDTEGHVEAMGIVKLLDEEATKARVREDAIADQQRERRDALAALDHLIAVVRAGREPA
jgi:hypothetical protein